MKLIRSSAWLKVFLYGLVIGVLYRSALGHLVLGDWFREDYSHCAVVPLVVLYLIWDRRARLGSVASSPSWFGLGPLVLGIGLFWLGELGGEYFSMYLSMWLVVAGLLWLHLGWPKIRAMAFPLCLALAMFPFPNFINSKVLLKLKLLSSQIGVAMLQMAGMSAYREGNVIDLGFTRLQVVDACSGLRYMLPLAVLSLIMAYGYRARFWKKAVLVLSSIPLAILVNSLRIALTGVLYRVWGAEVAEGFFHGFSGWLIFMVTLPVLLLEMWVLKRIGSPGERMEKPGPEAVAEVGGCGDRAGFKALRQPVFLAAMGLLVATVALSHGVEFREKVPVNRPLREFPMTVGGWTGTARAMDGEMVASLHFSDYIMASYQDGSGKVIDFYVAYYESQRKGEATHSPETCLPGGGWEFEDSGVQTVNTGQGRAVRISRVLGRNQGSRQLVYFWFPQRGRILTSLYQVKFYAFWDALTRQRTDGALVRVISEVYPGESMAAAEDRVERFVEGVFPVLEGFLP